MKFQLGLQLFLSATLYLVSASSGGHDEGRRNFNGYQVLTVGPITTDEQIQFLESLELESNEYDFWSSPTVNGTADIMTPPQREAELKQALAALGLEWTLKVEDVGRLISNEPTPRAMASPAMSWTAYPRWSTIEPWILSLPSKYPYIASVSTIGYTYERRSIYMVKISSGPPQTGTTKKVVFIDGNIHAREWIAGATATWILNELITNYGNYWDILSKIDFYIVPYVNVDGYEYSQTTDRMWRKTRSANQGSTCKGTDPNRNFAYKFGGESTSNNPCSDIYTGPTAFSESETRAIRDALTSIQFAKIGAYITLHCYGQKWLLPWGYTRGTYPADYNDLLKTAQASIADIYSVNGVKYATGQGADIYYGVGGASDDYAKSQGVKHTVTAELRDTGSYGFLLPASQIIPTAKEAWAGILRTTRTVMSEP